MASSQHPQIMAQRRVWDDPHVYQEVLQTVQLVLQHVVENEFEDSAHSVAAFTMNFSYKDNNSHISHYISGRSPDGVIRGRVLEAFAHWVRDKTRDLNVLVEMVESGQFVMSSLLGELKVRLEQLSYRSSHGEVISEFVYMVISELLGRDAACLGSVLAGSLIESYSYQQIMDMMEWPTTLLALLVRTLEDVQANVSRVAMVVYQEACLFSYVDSKNIFMEFFTHYTVDPCNGVIEVYEDPEDPEFLESQFKMHLISTFGALLKLLGKIETLCDNKNGDVVLAVDFEGVQLNRYGTLCLMQLTICDDPSFVYVLDVHVLGGRAFTLQTPGGTCMKALLEDPEVRKVWFDPRNDVDALYHQFGVVSQGIFDVQLAEVADRRKRGHNVGFVQSLNECLRQCPVLPAEQKTYIADADHKGKELYNPSDGGSYEVFKQRPLHPRILVYAAFDVRYMFLLYEYYLGCIGPQWTQRVLAAGQERGRWWAREYPGIQAEAPHF